MGGRLSVPRGPGGTTEASQALTPRTTPRRRGSLLNSRTLVAPLAAVILGGIFFVYSRTSIQAAKENAKRTREADGGSISWRNESRRRHGVLKKPEERSVWQHLFAGKEDEVEEKKRRELGELEKARRGDINPIEEGIRRSRERRVSRDEEEE